MLGALGREPNIEYIDMPVSIRDSYQYFTQAEIGNLRRAGFNADFTTIEQGVKRYVSGYLDRADRYSRDGARSLLRSMPGGVGIFKLFRRRYDRSELAVAAAVAGSSLP
jgi:hypothetical protein